MAQKYWMDNQQQQQNQRYTNNQGPDMGWGQFDYSQNNQSQNQQAAAAPAQPNYYDKQQQNYSNNSYGGNMFIPNQRNSNMQSNSDGEDYENEPPLLEELGINFSHIKVFAQACVSSQGCCASILRCLKPETRLKM